MHFSPIPTPKKPEPDAAGEEGSPAQSKRCPQGPTEHTCCSCLFPAALCTSRGEQSLQAGLPLLTALTEVKDSSPKKDRKEKRKKKRASLTKLWLQFYNMLPE
jgi:hypothetical protein